MPSDLAWWSCSHCGPHPDSGPRWCACGCGSDYNRMRIVDLTLIEGLEVVATFRDRCIAAPVHFGRCGQ